jgi:hypothetical protein
MKTSVMEAAEMPLAASTPEAALLMSSSYAAGTMGIPPPGIVPKDAPR